MANFQLDDNFTAAIKDLIQREQDKKLKKQLHELHYADIAEIIEQLELEEAIYLIKLLDSEKSPCAVGSMLSYIK